MEKNIKDIKILIADDISNNRLLIKGLLKSLGCNNVTEVDNGLDAIKKIENNDYDIVFMDIQMPILDGIVAARFIRHNLKKNIKIVAITAYDFIKVDNKHLFNKFIHKPYPIDEIKQAIDELIINV